MAVVARPGVPFDLKSTALSGLALLVRDPDLQWLAEQMSERFGASPGVFAFEPVVIDLSVLDQDHDASVDFAGLVALLESHLLLPAGVRGGSERLRQAALAAGLSDVSEDPTATVPSRGEPHVEPVSPVAAPRTPLMATSRLPGPADLRPPSTAAAAPIFAPTLIVDKPLRSGQQVYAKGGDLVVLATVNVGAEVIADGSIHVYGPLRGKAVAGAKGNVAARIFSTCMEPQLLAIAGTYRTTENPLPADVVGQTAQIRLEGDRLVFEPLA